MKILVIFIDMIRPNRLATFNSQIKGDNPLDVSLKELGGTYFKNCFSPGPDTPRGIATFTSGKIPYLNGCDTRVKWPRYFLDGNLKTIYDFFIENNYKMTFFSNPNERETGIFPDYISTMDVHNKDYRLDEYLSNITLEDDHFVFVGLPDYHWSFDDNGYTTHGEQQAYTDTKESYDLIFKNLNKDDFDHIFVFSDHGFKFTHEIKREKKVLLLNEDRTNIVMIHRMKGEDDIKYSDKLCSIADIYSTVEGLFKEKISNGVSLLSEDEREYIVIEDHLDFAPSVNQNIEIWAVVKKDIIYIRTLDNGYILDRGNRKILEGINVEYDDILKKESSFSYFYNEYQKVFKYREFIFKQTTFMHGGIRKKIPTFRKYLHILKDFVFEQREI